MYSCPKCGKDFKDEEIVFLQCPYCQNHVLFKKTPPVVVKVSTD